MLKQVKQSVLIVVDVQNGFTPGGNLAVANADEIIPKINQLAQKFEHIVLTQDWHPDQHISFADNHPNKKPFETIELDYGRQVLWPKHCVQGTPTGLNGYLREHQINTVYIVGIATDFCVAWTAIDAAELGFDTYVIEDACKAIDLNGSLQQAWQDMSQKGVHRIEASSILL
ncbi:nicotinamidase [Acinetobacter junii]|uniref:nicotinamidase n=1 Tax=Acinetobacter junii TaxID=40215 RepID=UPI0035F8175B